MNRPGTFKSRLSFEGSWPACRFVSFLAVVALACPSRGHAENVSLSYDPCGNEISVQTATAASPTILGSPPNQVVTLGGIGGFSITVASPLPVTYQWYLNGVAISGAMGDSLLFINITSANEGNYTVVVTNSSGSVTSDTFTLGIDFNGNGLPDSWEMAYFGNLNQTAGGDYDGDSISNLDEYYNGTNPTVREVYYWNVASGDFNTATNWIRHNTPGIPPRAPGAGDTAIIDTGTFTLPANTTITVSQVTVNAPFTAPADTNFTLNVTGNWSFNGPFTLTSGKQFAVSAGGTVTVAGTTNLNGANLLVESGGHLSFPNVTSYSVPAGSSVDWIAQRNGSALSFPNLTAITGPTTPNTYLDLIVRYDNNPGATLSLPALTAITKASDGDPYHDSGVRFTADGSGMISAPNLTTFHDNDSYPNSSLYAYNSGVLTLPALLTPKGVNISLNALSHPEQFTSLVGTRSFTVNGGTVVMSNLDSILGFSSIVAENGGHLSFPNVTSYSVPAGLSVDWIAQRNGSVLMFPNLTAITGPTTPNTYLDLIVRYDSNPGAVISLPALTSITKADDGDIYANSGVRLYAYSGSVLSAPFLSTFDDNDSHPNSSLNAEAGGTMNLYSLALSGIRGVTLNGVTLPPTVPPPKAINLSTRMLVQTGDNVGIGGFIITGSTTKRVIIRAIGPSLTAFGVPNALGDPVLELHGPSAFVTITNNDWRETQQNEIQATGIPPANDFESAIVVTLVPGAYTAIVRGNGNTSGVGLVEIYDLNQVADAKLANVSTRATVSTGDNIVIAGFVLSIGSGNDRIVVRGLGPSLTAFGVPNVLADPRLELRDTNGALISSNNDWHEDPAQAAELTAAGLAPTNNLESAIVVRLPTGLYTALLSGTNGNTGIGVVEVYDLGAPP
jgi:hypothetical protein